MIVIAVLVAVGVVLGLRALLRQADAGARRAPAKPEAFYWPVTGPTGPGQGVVHALLPDTGYAAVDDVRPEEWKLGNEVRFVDAENRLLAHGVVREVVKGNLHVEYEPEPDAPRALAKGDRAIRTGRTRPGPQTAPAP